MPNEQEPASESREAELEAEERAAMERLAEKVDPDTLEAKQVLTMNEHALVGSGLPGQAFFPNHAIAEVAGSLLEAINSKRKALNRKGETPFIVDTGESTIYAYAKLKPLTQEQIKDRDPGVTFTIVRTTNPITGEEVDVDRVDELINARMREAQNKARELLKSGKEMGFPNGD